MVPFTQLVSDFGSKPLHALEWRQISDGQANGLRPMFG